MEIPDVPVRAACARCGTAKVSGQPCPRCGTTANRPTPAQLFWAYVKGIGIVLTILAFCLGVWALVAWLSLSVAG